MKFDIKYCDPYFIIIRGKAKEMKSNEKLFDDNNKN
jgi:hypothetical protein